jgi:hypothetical protein
MKKIILALLLVVLFAVPAFGTSGSCVQTVATSITANDRIPDSETVIVTLTCTADVNSAYTFPSTVVALTPSSATVKPYNLYGYYLYQVGRTPSSNQTYQPTANYTVTITDTRGFALDLGLLTTNGSASAAQLTLIENSATGYPVVRSALTVAIPSTNNVSAAVITLDLIFKAK